MRNVKVAATQISCSWNQAKTLEKAEAVVREAASKGANIILLQELFETPYFCQQQKYEYMSLAKSVEENIAVKHFSKIAKELEVVLPISFFERDNNITFNSIAIIDADGVILGVYRKTHIPDGHCYQEKFYFAPGDTGFKVYKTRYASIGVGICWDQWFPEAARCMSLLGAEILFYPTAIGSEPLLNLDSMPHWRRCIQGHAAANIMPVVVSNRIGEEKETEPLNGGPSSMTFYGSSFIADQTGELVANANRTDQEVLIADFDLDAIYEQRYSWGVYRDRRPEMYETILQMH